MNNGCRIDFLNDRRAFNDVPFAKCVTVKMGQAVKRLRSEEDGAGAFWARAAEAPPLGICFNDVWARRPIPTIRDVDDLDRFGSSKVPVALLVASLNFCLRIATSSAIKSRSARGNPSFHDCPT